jgi:acetyltransferase-like isoleucine patch superfamily enzyme
MEIRKFDNGSFIIAERIQIGENFRIGADTQIRATECVIADNVTIGAHNRFLIGQHLEIGSRTILGHHNDLTARTVRLGEYVYWDSHVVVGHGGKFSPDAHLQVGSYSMICARTTLNVNHAISIGEQVGIGEDVDPRFLPTHLGRLPGRLWAREHRQPGVAAGQIDGVAQPPHRQPRGYWH